MVVLLRYIFQKKNKKKFWTKLRDLLFSIYGEGEGEGKGSQRESARGGWEGRGESNFGFPKNVARHASGYLVSVLYNFISEYSYIIQTCHVIAKSTKYDVL